MTWLAEALSAAGTLVVLDDCQHLINAVAPLTTELLGRVPAAAAGCQPLGVSGGCCARCPPAWPAGTGRHGRGGAQFPVVQLFADRAAAVAEICSRLDGLR